MAKPSKGKLLYHITHIKNMQSILEYGLLSRKYLSQSTLQYTDIANQGILTKRELYKESLSAYIPFHFFVKNPFDYAVCHTYGVKNLAIIAISRDLHKLYKGNFFIIPSHPLDKDQPDIYPYDDGFDKIKWSILDDKKNRDYDNPEIRKACMAECVCACRILPAEFSWVYVVNKNVYNLLKNLKDSRGNNVIESKICINDNMFP